MCLVYEKFLPNTTLVFISYTSIGKFAESPEVRKPLNYPGIV